MAAVTAGKRKRIGASLSSPKRRAPTRNANRVDISVSSVRGHNDRLPTWLKSAFFTVRHTAKCGRACFATAKLERNGVLLPLTEPTIAVHSSKQKSLLYCCMCFVRVPDDELACMDCGGCFCCCCFEQSVGWHRMECSWHSAAQHGCADSTKEGCVRFVRALVRTCACTLGMSVIKRMLSRPLREIH